MGRRPGYGGGWRAGARTGAAGEERSGDGCRGGRVHRARGAYFTTSALVHGDSEAILVDTQLTRSAGRELAEWVAGKARRLTAIIVTSSYADHYFGTEEVLRLFPERPSTPRRR
ncbi:MBL fold metallo-hydrolase [Streptacidiphilus monticola]